MGSRSGLDLRKISSPPGFDSGTSSLLSVATPTELPGQHAIKVHNDNLLKIRFMKFMIVKYRRIYYFRSKTVIIFSTYFAKCTVKYGTIVKR